MAELVHVGTADLPHGTGWDRYFRKLGYIETSVLVRNHARPSVLAKWRAAAPRAGAFGLVAPSLTANPLGVERGVDALLEASRTLEASAILLRTPPTFSPSQTNRDLLRRFFAEVLPAEAAGGAARVWQPDGLWDTRTAVKLAAEMGIVFGCDPSLRDQTREPPDFYGTLEIEDIYFRVSGLGRGARTLSAAFREELAELTTAYGRAWVVFATVDAIADAIRFRGEVAPLIGARADAGMPAGDAAAGDEADLDADDDLDDEDADLDEDDDGADDDSDE